MVKVFDARGWDTFWDRDILAGQSFDKVIEAELNDARCIIVLWSTYSINSTWVRGEAHRGLEGNRLVPILLVDIVAPVPFNALALTLNANAVLLLSKDHLVFGLGDHAPLGQYARESESNRIDNQPCGWRFKVTAPESDLTLVCSGQNKMPIVLHDRIPLLADLLDSFAWQ